MLADTWRAIFTRARVLIKLLVLDLREWIDPFLSEYKNSEICEIFSKENWSMFYFWALKSDYSNRSMKFLVGFLEVSETCYILDSNPLHRLACRHKVYVTKWSEISF